MERSSKNSQKERVAKRGAALTVVLMVLLAAMLLTSALLYLPGSVRRLAHHETRSLQKVYEAESAIIAFSQMYPTHYFEQKPWGFTLPDVQWETFGPWLRLKAAAGDAGEVSALAGAEFDSLSAGERRRLGEKLRLDLDQRMMKSENLEVMSGNRRFMGKADRKSIWVQEGDLLLDLDGEVKRFCAKVSGNVTVKGTAVYDTLRLYAAGTVAIRGQVKVRWLEAYGGDHVEVGQQAEFSGVLVGGHGVAIRDRGRGRFPAAAVAVDGPLEAEQKNLPDAERLMPVDEPGKLKLFDWRLR